MLTVHIFSKIINKLPLLFTGNLASRKNHVHIMWNAREIFMWNWCEKSTHTNSREIFQMNFAWKGFHFKTVWKSGELSYEFHLKFKWKIHMNLTLHEFRVFLDESTRRITWNSFLRKVHVRHNWLWYNITRMWTLSDYPGPGRIVTSYSIYMTLNVQWMQQ